jgi:ABC-type dipeptide/oligopeptide/nickel transport system permease component
VGLDRPFYVQFVKYLGNAVQGEFGLSLRQARKVSTLIKERLPATLELATAAALLAIAAAFRWASTRRCDEIRRCRTCCWRRR